MSGEHISFKALIQVSTLYHTDKNTLMAVLGGSNLVQTALPAYHRVQG